MTDARSDVSSDELSSRVTKAGWGVLLIWTGAALLLHWSWGAGLLGAGVIMVAAQALRGYLRVGIDGFGLVAGLLVALCGVWNIFDVTLNLVPLLFIGAGIALLLSIWTGRGTRRAPGEPPELHASPHPRV